MYRKKADPNTSASTTTNYQPTTTVNTQNITSTSTTSPTMARYAVNSNNSPQVMRYYVSPLRRDA